MDAALDLDAYLERIGYRGGRAPTLDTLRELHLRHAQTIAFENLDPLFGRTPRLDVPALETKLVRQGRGGYCFEHNALFRHALAGLGFQVTGLAARVVWSSPEGAIPPRTHMLLHVDFGSQAYIADVGFGGQTLTGPMRLEPDTPQATPHETYRLVKLDREHVLQSQIGETWRALYRFSLDEQYPPDYELANWWVSTHPSSKFVSNLIAARPAPGRRYALLNNQLTVHHLDGRNERRALGTAAELRQVLEDPFGIRLPEFPELNQLLERMAATPT